jgi:hypothetical protein
MATPAQAIDRLAELYDEATSALRDAVERFLTDGVAPPPEIREQPGDPTQGAGLVLQQNGNNMTHARSGEARMAVIEGRIMDRAPSGH